MASKKIPIGLRIISIYLIIIGILCLFYTVIIYSLTSSISQIRISQFPANTIITLIVLILTGILQVYLGWKLLKLSKIARNIALALIGAEIILLTANLFHPVYLIGLIINIAVFWYLGFSKESKKLFR